MRLFWATAGAPAPMELDQPHSGLDFLDATTRLLPRRSRISFHSGNALLVDFFRRTAYWLAA